jgi:AcrR family transcriptional regulator
MEIFSAELEAIRASSRAPEEKVRAVWEFFYRYYHAYPDYYHMLMFLHREGVPASLSREVIDDVNRRAARNFRLAAAIVREGMDAGVYRRLPPRQVVDLLWSLMMGLVQLAETRRNLGVEVGTLEELHRDALALVEQGLRAQGADCPMQR